MASATKSSKTSAPSRTISGARWPRGRASGLGQPSRGATRRRSTSPKLSIARAALPIFSPSCGRTRTMTGGWLNSSPLAHIAGKFLEVLRLAGSRLIDAGEADIGDPIQALQPLHHQLADLLRRDLGVAHRLQLALDAGDQLLDLHRIDRPLARGDRDRADQLVAIERLALVLDLTHGQLAQLDALERGEARAQPRTGAGAGSPPRLQWGGCPSPGCLHVRRRGSASIAPDGEAVPARSPTRPPTEYPAGGWPGGGAGQHRTRGRASNQSSG